MMPPEPQKELSMLMSPPVIAGVVTWLVSQIVMIILMINHKPKMSIPPSGYHQSAKGYRFDAA